MVENKDIILERLQGILNHWNRNNLQLCLTMSIDLTKFSWTFKLKNELFMSEILETIFDNIENVQNDLRFIINKPEEITMREKITKNLKALIDNYKKNDFSACTDILKEIRYIATLYQLDTTYNANGDKW